MLKIFQAKLSEQEALLGEDKNGRVTPKLKSNMSQFSKKAGSTVMESLPELNADKNQVIADTNLANYFLFKWQSLIDGQESLELANPPLLFSDFINCLIMAVHLKTGHVINLAGNLSNYIKKRIHPIMENTIRPKVLMADESAILSRGKEILGLSDERWRKEIKQIWQILISEIPHKIPVFSKEPISSSRAKENSVSIVISNQEDSSKKTVFGNDRVKQSGGFGGYLHGLDLKSFLNLMIESKQIRYETIEDKRLLWMALERSDDPDESLFKLIMKIERRNGKTHEEIEKRIHKWLSLKLRSEIQYPEFEDHFLIHFCKFVSFDCCKNLALIP